MSPEEQKRMLLAQQRFRNIHPTAPLPFDTSTGYDPYGLSGLSEHEMRLRTTAQHDYPPKAMHMRRPEHDDRYTPPAAPASLLSGLLGR